MLLKNSGKPIVKGAEIVFEERRPPKGIPENCIPKHRTYKWIKRGDKDYSKLVNLDKNLTEEEIKDLEETLMRILGGPSDET